jgi:hypothetical protein
MRRTTHAASLPRFLATLCIITASMSSSCSKRASPGDYLIHVSKAVDCYIHTNVIGAEAAMLDAEHYTKQCERTRVYGINFDQHYAAIYSRLYLVETALGNTNNAAKYYQLALERWKRFNSEDNPESHVAETIDQQIKGVDRYFEKPIWKIGTE